MLTRPKRALFTTRSHLSMKNDNTLKFAESETQQRMFWIHGADTCINNKQTNFKKVAVWHIKQIIARILHECNNFETWQGRKLELQQESRNCLLLVSRKKLLCRSGMLMQLSTIKLLTYDKRGINWRKMQGDRKKEINRTSSFLKRESSIRLGCRVIPLWEELPNNGSWTHPH